MTFESLGSLTFCLFNYYLYTFCSPFLQYSVTSLKTIPELCRRCDSQNEDRSGMMPIFVHPSYSKLCFNHVQFGNSNFLAVSCCFVFSHLCTVLET